MSQINNTDIFFGMRQLLIGEATLNHAGSFNVGEWASGIAVYINWSAGCSAGKVMIETADRIDYAGTWAPLLEVSWTAADKQDIIQFDPSVLAVRVRISDAIVGGTVTCTAKVQRYH